MIHPLFKRPVEGLMLKKQTRTIEAKNSTINKIIL